MLWCKFKPANKLSRMCASPWLHHPAPALLRSKQRRAHCCLRLQRSPGKEDEAAGKELGKNHLRRRRNRGRKSWRRSPQNQLSLLSVPGARLSLDQFIRAQKVPLFSTKETETNFLLCDRPYVTRVLSSII